MTRRDWTEMTTDELDAPSGWSWDVSDRLAHRVWNLTETTPEVGWGPDPPFLLELLMGFFPNKSVTDAINSWYLTRKTGRTYNTETEWWDIGNQFGSADGDPNAYTGRIYDTGDQRPHPLRAKVHSQQYTARGAMFTYDIDQWQGGDVDVFMRIPAPSDTHQQVIDDVEELPFEFFQYQSRVYDQQYADAPIPNETTYAHPHFRDDGDVTEQDLIDLFETAFEHMSRNVIDGIGYYPEE